MNLSVNGINLFELGLEDFLELLLDPEIIYLCVAEVAYSVHLYV